MRRSRRFLIAAVVLLSLAMLALPDTDAAAGAGPVVTSLSLRSGPTTGGTGVYVRGRAAGISGRGATSHFLYRLPPPQVTRMSRTVGNMWGATTVLYGRYLEHASAVLVDGVRQWFYASSGGRLVVNLSMHKQGPAYLRVVTPSGTSPITPAARFTFHPLADITRVYPSDGPTSGGTHTVIHASSLDAVTGVSFGSVALPFTVDATGVITATTPAHRAGTVHVFVTTRVGRSLADHLAVFRYGRPQPVTWSSPVEVDPDRTVTALSCPQLDFCAATDSDNAWMIAPDGQNWSLSGRPAGGRAVSCVSPTSCLSLTRGGPYLSTWDGTTWSALSRLPGVPYASDVVCTSPSFCAALVDAGRLSFWDGSAWSVPASPATDAQRAAGIPGNETFTLSCWADGECGVVNINGSFLLLHAGSWSYVGQVDRGVMPEGIDNLTCASAGFCMASTRYGGTVQIAPSGVTTTLQVLPSIDKVTCRSATSCIAWGGASVATFDGSSWSTSSAAPEAITAVSCPAERICVASSAHAVYHLTW